MTNENDSLKDTGLILGSLGAIKGGDSKKET